MVKKNQFAQYVLNIEEALGKRYRDTGAQMMTHSMENWDEIKFVLKQQNG